MHGEMWPGVARNGAARYGGDLIPWQGLVWLGDERYGEARSITNGAALEVGSIPTRWFGPIVGLRLGRDRCGQARSGLARHGEARRGEG